MAVVGPIGRKLMKAVVHRPPLHGTKLAHTGQLSTPPSMVEGKGTLQR